MSGWSTFGFSAASACLGGVLAMLVVSVCRTHFGRLRKVKLRRWARLVEDWADEIGYGEPDELDTRVCLKKEQKVDNFLREHNLGTIRLRFSWFFRRRFLRSHGWKNSNMHFEHITRCPANGIAVSDFWMELRVAKVKFIDNYGDGNPEHGIQHVENRVKLLRMYVGE